MWFRKPKPKEEALKPGICECGHDRCHHRNGKDNCVVDLTETVSKEMRDAKPNSWWSCSCQIFILDEDDDDDDDSPETPIDPELAQLKKIAGVD
jgi:hypothetical protein